MIPGSANPLLLKSAAAAGGLQISRSIRLNSADSAYFSRTPAVAGNRRTWTWAGWVKRSALGASQTLFEANPTGGATYTLCTFTSGDQLQVVEDQGGGGIYYPVTSAVYRDTSAWYHLVFVMDTTLATSTDRIKIYVNGVLQTQTGPFPPLNNDTYINATNQHRIGYRISNSSAFSGYLANIHFIDGQALTPSSFTETDATTGQLIPKTYTGSYGTNGFNLLFADNSSNTASTLGKDTSGNSNNWTPNNLSVTAGSGNDSLVDVPTNGAQTDTGVGGEVRGNYCTWNPLDQGGSITLANGNLDVTTPSSGLPAIRGTVAVSSGKWYFEHYVQSGATSIGILKVTDSVAGFLGGTSGGYSYYSEGAGYTKKINNNVQTDYGASFVAGDTIGVAFDLDAGTITFYKNGSSQGQAFSGLSGTFAPAVSDGTNVAGIVGYTNFGQRPFAYTAPSGFKALCTANLPAPLVTKSNTVMDVKLYTGNGSTQTISGLGFSPDWVWLKSRSGAFNHALFDTIRTAGYQINSNLTDAETFDATKLSAFTSDGFTLGSAGGTNGSGSTFAAWCWDAGTSTVSNTQGSITSQVRANTTAGFSVVTFDTASFGGASATVGHGLGVAPSFYIVKPRDMAGVDWHSYHISLGNTQRISLNSTAAAVTSSFWNNTSPTSTVFSLSNAWSTIGRCVAYCFSSVVGYSNGFSYTGNGSSDGPMVYLGFRPRLILLKRSDSDVSGNASWWMYDTARSTYNIVANVLGANLSSAETTPSVLDILSNGFKLRETGSTVNASGGTFIGFAWAESPFNYSRAR